MKGRPSLQLAGGRPDTSDIYTGSASQSITKPAGATKCRVQIISIGDTGFTYGGDEYGEGAYSHWGSGGGYSDRTTYNIAGLSTLYIVNSTSAFTEVRETNSSGTVIAKAFTAGAGVNSTSGVGDVRTNGTAGGTGAVQNNNGQAANGPNGLGVAPAGAAGNGNNYGGGGMSSGVTAGTWPGGLYWVKITWSY